MRLRAWSVAKVKNAPQSSGLSRLKASPGRLFETGQPVILKSAPPLAHHRFAHLKQLDNLGIVRPSLANSMILARCTRRADAVREWANF